MLHSYMKQIQSIMNIVKEYNQLMKGHQFKHFKKRNEYAFENILNKRKKTKSKV